MCCVCCMGGCGWVGVKGGGCAGWTCVDGGGCGCECL